MATYYAGAGDGGIIKSGTGDWDTQHDALTGSSAFPTGSNIAAPIAQWDTFNRAITRAFFPVDTSGIDDSATVTGAVLYHWIHTKEDGDDDGYDWINVVQTTQADPTTLTTADYDQCGAVNDPTEGATRIDIGDITTGGYTGWTLNATGLSWVKKTAGDPYTMLGLREGHDALDHPIDDSGGAKRNRVQGYFSEQTGTDNDPYLDVTTSSGDSLSASASPSISPSISPSVSPSVSPSPSYSPSVSESLSPSVSPSISPSVSPSISPSLSPSISPSVSPSIPPNADYSRGEYAALPADDSDLTTVFSVQDYIDVESDNNVFVDQTAESTKFAVFLFKDQAPATGWPFVVTWKGKSDLAPSSATVYLQIYNRTTAEWETLDSNNTAGAGEEFTLTGGKP